MSIQIDDRKVFSLLDVTLSIRKTLNQRYGSAFWVRAEMIKLNHYPHSGHCYPDLVEKKEGKVVAQIRSNLWRTDFQRINRRFKETLKEPLKDGIKIFFLARIDFDPQYGLSLHILDIDPAFTLGDLEQEKQKTIARLRADKLFDKNRSLALPLLPHRVAVISVETSKGYADFRKVIDHNEWGYAYFYFLFPALLQGEKAVGSIIHALERIRKVQRHFDIVAIIRGGGGDIGLSCYNDYELTRAIAAFPLPVISGIGHATNETVTELIAYQNCITPTKMAEWLLQRTHRFATPLQRAEEYLVNRTKYILQEKKEQFNAQLKYFKSAALNLLTANHNRLYRLRSGMGQHAFFNVKYQRNNLLQKENELVKEAAAFLSNQKAALEGMQQSVKLMAPDSVLKRGYSITYLSDKLVTSVDQLEEGAEITTHVSDGILKGKITFTQKINSDE